MPYREHILPLLPGLRRFAVALIAPHETRSCRDADEIVTRAVQSVAREGKRESEAAWRHALYSALVRFAQARGTATAPAVQRPSLADGLHNLQLPHRAALLLVTIGGFSYDEAAAVLGVSRNVLMARVSTARQILAKQIEAPLSGAGRTVPHLRIVK